MAAKIETPPGCCKYACPFGVRAYYLAPMQLPVLPAQARAALLGLAVGDALGVPVEFQPRAARQKDPVTGMRAFGTHHQPAGTWSDDSSLTFCLAESLTTEYNLADIAQKLVRWYENGYWTAHGRVFDVGIATADALRFIQHGGNLKHAGGTGEHSNGNGSLMRILPLVFYSHALPIEERFELTKDISSITHAHIRSVLACFIYLEFARQLIKRVERQDAYLATRSIINQFRKSNSVAPEAEWLKFHRVLGLTREPYEPEELANIQEDQISSSGYVVHTLEAALWCLLKHDSYAATVLAAVNLGDDTDTTGAGAGGLAGLAYGEAGIPAEWLAVLARRADIENLAGRLVGE